VDLFASLRLNQNDPQQSKPIYNDNFQLSDENKAILAKTLNFMSQDLDEFALELVSFVHGLMRHIGGTNSTNYKNHHNRNNSSFVESLRLDKVEKERYFVELGTSGSSELIDSGWKGVIVDSSTSGGDDLPFEHYLIDVDRDIYVLNSCISPRRQVYVEKIGQLDWRKDVYVPCFSVNTILEAAVRARGELKPFELVFLHAWSGDEELLSLIESIDLRRFSIEMFCVRQSAFETRRDRVIKLMVANGYRFIRQENEYLFFKKKSVIID
jgi:hypothetical protein